MIGEQHIISFINPKTHKTQINNSQANTATLKFYSSSEVTQETNLTKESLSLRGFELERAWAWETCDLQKNNRSLEPEHQTQTKSLKWSNSGKKPY